jgi:hypothetical protein
MLTDSTRTFIYYSALIGTAAALTHVFYLYVNGLV